MTYYHKLGLCTALIICLASIAGAVEWDSTGWGYYREFNISNSNGATLTNFQVDLQFDLSVIKANALDSCNDIRFVIQDEGTWDDSLYYFIDNKTGVGTGCNIDGLTNFTVNVTLPANSNTTVRMYYNYTAASGVSNASRVFNLWEDFLVDPPDTDIWKYYGGAGDGMSVTDGYFQMTGAVDLDKTAIYTNREWYCNNTVQFYYQYDLSTTDHVHLGFCDTSQGETNCVTQRNMTVLGPYSYSPDGDKLWVTTVPPGGTPTNTLATLSDPMRESTWIEGTLNWSCTGTTVAKVGLKDNFGNYVTLPTAPNGTAHMAAAISRKNSKASTLRVDWILVRSWANLAPAFTPLGDEQIVEETPLPGRYKWQIRLYVDDTNYVNSTIGYFGLGDIMNHTLSDITCGEPSLYDDSLSIINTTARYDYEDIESWDDIDLPLASILFNLSNYAIGNGIWSKIKVIYYNDEFQTIEQNLVTHPNHFEYTEDYAATKNTGTWNDMANITDGDDNSYGNCASGECYLYLNFTFPENVASPYGFWVKSRLGKDWLECYTYPTSTCTRAAKEDGILQMQIYSKNAVDDYASSISCYNGSVWRLACQSTGTDAGEMDVYYAGIDWNITEPIEVEYNISLDNTWFDVKSVDIGAFSLTGANVSISNIRLYQSGDPGFCSADSPQYLAYGTTQNPVYVINQTIDRPLWNVTVSHNGTSIWMSINESHECVNHYVFYPGGYLYNTSNPGRGTQVAIPGFPVEVYHNMNVSDNPLGLWNYISLSGCDPQEDLDWEYEFYAVLEGVW